VGAVIGGLASIVGPLVGGIFTFWLPIVSSQFVSTQAWIPAQIVATFKNAGPQVTYGALLILIMIFAPNGVVGLVTAGYVRLQARLRGAGDRGSGQMPTDAQTV
jgi:ABC-type branched-subunit amino acid transport system permease subunit